MVWRDGDLYEGEWLEDKMSSRGVIAFSCGHLFDGMFDDCRQSAASATAGCCATPAVGSAVRTAIARMATQRMARRSTVTASCGALRGGPRIWVR